MLLCGTTWCIEIGEICINKLLHLGGFVVSSVSSNLCCLGSRELASPYRGPLWVVGRGGLLGLCRGTMVGEFKR